MGEELAIRDVLLEEIARRRGISLEDLVRDTQIRNLVHNLDATIASRWHTTLQKAPKTFQVRVRAFLVLIEEVARLRRHSCDDLAQDSSSLPPILTLVEAFELDATIASRWHTALQKAPKTFQVRVRAFLVLVEEAARLRGDSFDDLAQDSSSLPPILTLVEAFEQAILPRKLPTVLGDLAVFRARVATFLERHRWTDREIEVHAKRLWGGNDIATPDADRLVQHIPSARLRTYSDDQLRTIAGHFITWDPLMRFLTDLAFRASASDAEELSLAQLRKKLEARLRSRWPNVMGGYGAEDAVQETLQSVNDPEHGYTFEGDFAGWLYKTANHRLGSHWNVARGHVPLPNILPSVPPMSESTYEELFKKWQERYLLAESFFQRRVRTRVKEIWADMLSKTEETEIEETDVDLACRIARKTGRHISPKTVPTIRRRLRQRLDVLRFILDDVPNGTEDVPGDVSVLNRIWQKWGLAQKDWPTIRHLAALARAAQEDTPQEGVLAWALLSRFLIDQRQPLNEAQMIVLSLLGTTDSPDCETVRRFNAAQTWTQSQQRIEIIKNLHQETRKSGIGFFLSPCWYLAVLQGKSAGDALRILLPAQGEEEQRITTIMHKLA